MEHANPELRNSMILGKDLFVAFLTISAIGIAAENLRRTAAAARASVALHFIERWNDPKLADARKQWHQIYYDLKRLQLADIGRNWTPFGGSMLAEIVSGWMVDDNKPSVRQGLDGMAYIAGHDRNQSWLCDLDHSIDRHF
jgi:hypothetical protein